MSKVVVVFLQPHNVPCEKTYTNALAHNNDYGFLIITKEGKGETIAVYKEWLHWEKRD